MSDPDNMDRPVTKRDLLDAFDNLLGAFMPRLDERFATKRDIDTRLEEVNRDLRQLVSSEADATRREIREFVRTQQEQHRREIELVDDRYRDLPERVGKLEAAVFRPSPPVKRQRRR
ncbi:MAG TPA: hypothetical protein VLB44_04050 [Kofleriaceae bacterium]|nr:hypothetical protein [Kofleriaceae bacterium]